MSKKSPPLLAQQQGHGDDGVEQTTKPQQLRRSQKMSLVRAVIIIVMVVLVGVTVGSAIIWAYYQWIHKSSATPAPVPSPIESQWIDPNMKRFWFERQLPFQLYYNHSSLANATIFPRVTKVSWGGMNGAEAQLDLCHRIVWVIDRLLNVSQPTKYLMPWQSRRAENLQRLRAVYVDKIDTIHNLTTSGDGVVAGMIPKWYITLYSKYNFMATIYYRWLGCIDRAAFPSTVGTIDDQDPTNYTWWSSTPPTGLAGGRGYVMGTEMETDLLGSALPPTPPRNGSGVDGVVWSRHAMYHMDIGRSNLATNANVKMVDEHGSVRLVSIPTYNANGESEVLIKIKASPNLSDAAKRVMATRLLEPQLVEIESAVVRLARAYSPDRGNLIVESGMVVLWDSLASAVPPPTPSASPWSRSSLQVPLPLPFAVNPYRVQPCLRIANTSSSLKMLVSSLRDRDILLVSYGTDTINPDNDWYPHYITVYRNTSGIYVSDMITEFERTSLPYRGTPSRSRQLLVRSLATINPTDGSVSINAQQTQSDASSIAPINLFGWNDWIVHSNVSYAQVWGRAKYGSIDEPIDATVEVANGNIITSDVNGMITEYGTRCNWLVKRYNFCSSYDGRHQPQASWWGH